MKKALWVCTYKLTEEDRKKIIALAGEDVEFMECHILMNSHDIGSDVSLLKKLIRLYEYTYVITVFDADITFRIWRILDGRGISYIAEKNKISRTSAPSREFIKITNTSDIDSHRTGSEVNFSCFERIYGNKKSSS